MIEALFEGLLLVLQWKAFAFMLLGIGVGFWVGLLPGLGGVTTLALMLPFIYAMTPIEGFAFLLGMHSVVATTGDITSVLFGIPGEGTTAATILDGHAMAKKGEAGRALGAALASSLVGALVGAFGGVVGCFAGYQARTGIVRALGTRDIYVALVEDLVTIAGSLWVVSRF